VHGRTIHHLLIAQATCNNRKSAAPSAARGSVCRCSRITAAAQPDCGALTTRLASKAFGRHGRPKCEGLEQAILARSSATPKKPRMLRAPEQVGAEWVTTPVKGRFDRLMTLIDRAATAAHEHFERLGVPAPLADAA
jgi:hypothetical protein